MAKRPSLVDAMNNVKQNNIAPTSKNTPKKTSKAKNTVEKKESTVIPESRKDKKIISGFFNPEVSKQLKLLAIEKDTTLQNLLAESLNELFLKYGKSVIAK